jgi:hypothetical protein
MWHIQQTRSGGMNDSHKTFTCCGDNKNLFEKWPGGWGNNKVINIFVITKVPMILALTKKLSAIVLK